MLVDTGAQEHCCGEFCLQLLHKVQMYTDTSCPVKLVGAGSLALHVIASGYYKNFPGVIYIVKNLDQNLFSPSKSGLLIHQIPQFNSVSLDTNHMCGVLVDKQTQIKLVMEKEMTIDLSLYDHEKYKST